MTPDDRHKLLKPALIVMALFAVLTVSAQTGAMVTLPSKTQTRAEVISNIEAQTSYKVIYSNATFDTNKSVNFRATEISLTKLLDGITEGSGNGYTIDKIFIVIHKTAEAAKSSQVVILANRSLTGTVADSEGNVLEGVRVELVASGSTGKSTETFANGRFKIEGVTPGSHVVKLTSPDGQTVRFKEVIVPTGSDADVSLELGSVMLQTAADAETLTTQSVSQVKTTAYFVPNSADNTIKAFTDEPKTSYSLTPEQNVGTVGYLPKWGIKTNLLYYGATTPNLSVEFALARKWTMDIAAGYNPFQWQKDGVNLWGYVQPEARYWFCQRFEKHFLGLHGLYTKFNIGDTKFPFTNTFEEHRYDGWGAGAGLSYGYHLPIGGRWAMEFTVGVGYVYLRYDKFRCYDCDEFVATKESHYFGPTKAGISLIFMIK